MMAFKIPKNFDGAKFAARYNLKLQDFCIENDGLLHLRKGLEIENPIFEQCDPRPPSLMEKLRDIKNIDPQLKEILTGILERV